MNPADAVHRFSGLTRDYINEWSFVNTHERSIKHHDPSIIAPILNQPRRTYLEYIHAKYRGDYETFRNLANPHRLRQLDRVVKTYNRLSYEQKLNLTVTKRVIDMINKIITGKKYF